MVITVGTIAKLVGWFFSWIVVYLFVDFVLRRLLKVTRSARNLAATYFVVAVLATVLGAYGDADGGPINFTSAPLQISGSLLAFAINYFAARGQSVKS